MYKYLLTVFFCLGKRKRIKKCLFQPLPLQNKIKDAYKKAERVLQAEKKERGRGAAKSKGLDAKEPK